MKLLKSGVALLLACSLLALFVPAASAAAVTFADPNFEAAVRGYLGLSGPLDTTILAAVTKLDLSYTGITNFADLQYFTGLTDLNVSGNDATSIDFSKFTHLMSLDCEFCGLTSLNLSKNTALNTLYCGLDNDVNFIFLMMNMYYSYGYTYDGNITLNQISSLDLSHNTSLYDLDCSGNPLTALDLSHNQYLNYLDCSGIYLTALNLSHNLSLRGLSCESCGLTSSTLDISKNTVLQRMNCYNYSDDFLNSFFSTINIPHGIELSVQNNRFDTLDLSNCSNLESFYCVGTHLTSLALPHTPTLDQVDCSDNDLTSLDVSGCKNLLMLEASYNKLTSIEISGSFDLVLGIGYNAFTTLDFSGDSLGSLSCNDNQLTSIMCSDNMYYLNASNNQLTSVTVPAGLQGLDLAGNPITDPQAYKDLNLAALTLTENGQNHSYFNLDGAATGEIVSDIGIYVTCDPYFHWDDQDHEVLIYVSGTTDILAFTEMAGLANFAPADGVEVSSPDARVYTAHLSGNTFYILIAPAVTGDVNQDGKIDTTDARLVLQSIVGKADLSGDQVTLADVNGDNKVDTVDARLILQYIVGKIKTL